MATLAPAPETTASKSSVREITHWINGAPVRGTLQPASATSSTPPPAPCRPASRSPLMPK